MHLPWYLGNAPHDIQFLSFGIIPLTVWSVVWKGLALWHAARRGEKWWFGGLLIVNTIGLLEILYLLLVVRIQDKPEKQNDAVKAPAKKTVRRAAKRS